MPFRRRMDEILARPDWKEVLEAMPESELEPLLAVGVNSSSEWIMQHGHEAWQSRATWETLRLRRWMWDHLGNVEMESPRAPWRSELLAC